MTEDVKLAAIWATAITAIAMGFIVLIYQGVEASQRNKVVCIESGATWIGGAGHCIQTGGM